MGKLLDFDFTIEYKPGTTNVVADALSRRDTPEEGAILAFSAPRFDFVDRLRHAQLAEPAIIAIRDDVLAGIRTAPWAIVDGMLQYAGRLYIPPASPLLHEILEAVHAEGHEGVQRTLHRLRRDFHFPNMKQVVQDFVRGAPLVSVISPSICTRRGCCFLCLCRRGSGQMWRLISLKHFLEFAASRSS